MSKAIFIAILTVALAGPLRAQLTPGSAAEVGMSQSRLDQATAIIQSEIDSGHVASTSILVARHGRIVLHQGFGHLSRQPGAPPTQPDSVYFIASITKPVTACALMLLVERGKVALSDQVKRYIPEFTGDDRDKILVRDLLRHASGLPDMLPDNIALRRAHAPLSAFVKEAITTPLVFPPETQFRYQSMGLVLSGEILERVTGIRLPDFEMKEIFEPLGMKDSTLGLPKIPLDQTVMVDPEPGVSPEDEASWGQNSTYWRSMGQPWCGMHTTTMDLAILLQTFLDGGAYDGRQVFSLPTTRAMTSNQNVGLNSPWGLGWMLGRSTTGNVFGELISEKTFGHSGGNGTVAWADPETGVVCVILSNRHFTPAEQSYLRRVSNAVAASVVSKQGEAPWSAANY